MKKSTLFSWRMFRLAALSSSLMALPAMSQAQTSSSFSISITEPTNGAIFITPANVGLAASVYDPLGEAADVEFTAGLSGGVETPVRLLGVVSNFISLDPPYRTYLLEWSNAPAGNWTLGAAAIGSNGGFVAAAPVSISIQSGYMLSVAITSPSNGASYPGPTNIALMAGVQFSNDAPAYVGFYDNGQLLGIVSNFFILDAGPGFPHGGRGYELDWSGQISGKHELTASVTDTNGEAAWSAPVTITIGNANALSIQIVTPTNGQAFAQPANVPIDASALDPGSNVAFVQFAASPAGGSKQLSMLLGTVSNWVAINPPRKDFILVWSNAPAGPWLIEASAVLDNGTYVEAEPVQITVQPNFLLTVVITSPTNGASYAGPTNIELAAEVQASNATPAFVEFFDNAKLLGVVSNAISAGPEPGGIYVFDWTGQSPGKHELTACVTDTNGDTAWSGPVTLSIGNSNAFSIQIASPSNGQTFAQPVNVPIDASVMESASNVAYVNFTATGPPPVGLQPQYILELGVVSNWVSISPPRMDYVYVWSNAPAGSWWVTATAVLSNGSAGGWATVQFQVVNSATNTNYLPIVRITSPPNKSAFVAPVNLALLAYAYEPGGFVASVQFYAGSNSLGYGRQLTNPVVEPLSSSISPPYPIYLTNWYELMWSNPPPGAYALIAVATENNGVVVTSAPVNVAILPPPPPPTNVPALVGIVATDPVAIEGTNCWPWLGGPATWSNWESPAAVWRWFTNCGPKDASFTVYRHGDTNKALNVQYSIGGSASNGLEYAGLPGVVTIPAGQTAAMITVVPIDDGPPDLNSTVALTLQADTNAPANYAVGYPKRAEVIILDTVGPQAGPVGAFLPDRTFHLSLTGPDGAWFHVDYSTDLLNWTPLCTNQVVNGSIDFLDPDAGNWSSRMYRAVPLANPPSN